jgi:hypothetical protein
MASMHHFQNTLVMAPGEEEEEEEEEEEDQTSMAWLAPYLKNTGSPPGPKSEIPGQNASSQMYNMLTAFNYR